MYIIMSDTFIKIDLNLELFWTNNNPIIEWSWVGYKELFRSRRKVLSAEVDNALR